MTWQNKCSSSLSWHLDNINKIVEVQRWKGNMEGHLGSITLLITECPSANLAAQEKLPSVCTVPWTLLSNHAKWLRLVFPTIKEQEKSGTSCQNFNASYSEGGRTSKRVVWRKCIWGVLASMCPENWERQISVSLQAKSSLDKMGVLAPEYKHQGRPQCSLTSTQRKISNDQRALLELVKACEGRTEKKGCVSVQI